MLNYYRSMFDHWIVVNEGQSNLNKITYLIVGVMMGILMRWK